jgi:hypothetical protein
MFPNTMLNLFFLPNWYANPPEQSVVDEVAAAPAVRDVVEDDSVPTIPAGRFPSTLAEVFQGWSCDMPPEQNVVDEVAAASAVRDNVEDDYPSAADDVDDEVTGKDDERLEEPVAIVMIVAPPLRRSKRVAAQQCKALRSGVAPSPYATSGLRRSARLAGLPRVNYKC